MAYRIHLLGLYGVAAEDMKSEILKLSPEFDPAHFENPEIFSSNKKWSALAVSKRSEIGEQFPKLASKAPGIWITTNDLDDWHLKIQNRATLLANLHLPLVNVDPDEWCEADGEEVCDTIACELPEQISKQIGESEASDAWPAYFEYSKQLIEESLTRSGIPFDVAKLSQLFSEDDFGEVSDAVGAQLGFFVNEVLDIGLDLSSADD